MLQIVEEICQFLCDFGVIRTMNVQKDPGGSVIKDTVRPFLAAGMESVAIEPMSKQIEGGNDNNIGLIQNIIIRNPRLQ